jgi:hypothetical protein
VIALLNRIPVKDGGAGGSLGGRIISGLSSDALYGAILTFEGKHFSGPRKGFVEPGGAMLRLMEDLAARTATAPQHAVKEDSLDILRRNVLDETPVRGVWTAGELVAFDPLITLAVRHIDSLKDQGFKTLVDPIYPYYIEMFGRAHFSDYPPRKSMRMERLRTWAYSPTQNIHSQQCVTEPSSAMPVASGRRISACCSSTLTANAAAFDGTTPASSGSFPTKCRLDLYPPT